MLLGFCLFFYLLQHEQSVCLYAWAIKQNTAKNGEITY